MITESSFVAIAPPTPSADYVTIRRESIAFEQTIQADVPVRLLAAPNGDAARYGDVGTLLYPAMRGRNPVACRALKYDPARRPGSVSMYCLVDINGDGVFDGIWDHPIFGDAGQMFLLDLHGNPTALTAPVPAEPAPDGERTQGKLSLRYLGPTADQRDASGVVHATRVAFEWGNYGGDYGALYRFEVTLNDAGEADVTARDGAVLGHIRHVEVQTGAAEFKVGVGFSIGRRTYISGRRESGPAAPAAH